MSSGDVSLGALVRYFAWLGTVGFGGPVILVERMRRDLQEERGWYTHAEFKEGLALAQLAPGPLAAQLAIYLGWVRRGVVGATAASIAFIGPSFVMVLALSAAYVRFGGLQGMRGRVLRNRRCRHRADRAQCVATHLEDRRTRPSTLVSRCAHRSRDGVDPT